MKNSILTFSRREVSPHVQAGHGPRAVQLGMINLLGTICAQYALRATITLEVTNIAITVEPRLYHTFGRRRNCDKIGVCDIIAGF